MLEGQTIGNYRILARLGEGGMGVVYKAEDTRLGRLVAIKFPTPGGDRQTFRARFLNEARAISALNHPHIATVHDYGETPEGEPFLVMELVGGQDLNEKLRTGTLTLGEAVQIIAAVAGALDAAHRRGIVHRDVKPSNVRISNEQQVKVLDFGLSKQIADFKLDADAETMRPPPLTSPGIVVGTPNYLSPEQARAIPVDARSDIFALGALLYECITGRPAFAGSNVIEIGGQVLHVDPPLPSEINPNVPAELDQITLKALAKDPTERYQTAAEMQTDLELVAATLGRAADEIVVPLEYPTEPPTQRSASARQSLRQRRRRTMRRWPIVALVALVAVLAVGAFLYMHRSANMVNSLAVLPFTNADGNPDTKYLSDGLTESLINSLSQSLPIKVMSRNAVFRYEGKQIEPREIGRELGVSAVLTGRVEAHGDALSISVELIDASDNTHIWGNHYNRRMNDVLALQEEIARETATHLQQRLQPMTTASTAVAAPKHYTDNIEAYQAYLRGRYFWNRRNEEGFKKAIEAFNEAISHDPAYALAYAGIADSYALLSDHSILPPRDAMPKAKAAAERALELDPNLAEGHTSLAFVEMAYDWNWRGAEAEYAHAIALNPNYATAHQWYSSDLVQMNRFPEALSEIRRAQELDPLSLIINANSGLYLFYSGPEHYDEAAREVQKALEVDQTFGVAHLYLAYIYEQQPAHRGEVIGELQKAVPLMGDDAETRAALGYAYAIAGKQAEARKILNWLQTPRTGSYVSPYFVALVHTGLGERDLALASLYQAYKDRHPGMIFMRIDPRFAPLRSDPRFVELQKHVEQAEWDEIPSLEELLKHVKPVA
jgi:serine/threonine protein kinase/Tfp pilus assembly protein PilF